MPSIYPSAPACLWLTHFIATRGTSVKAGRSPARRRLNLPICPSRRCPWGRGRRIKAPAPRSRGKSGWGAVLLCSSPFLIPSLLLLLHPLPSPRLDSGGFRVRLALPWLASGRRRRRRRCLSPIECCRCSLGRWLSRSGRVRDRPRGQINGERNQGC